MRRYVIAAVALLSAGAVSGQQNIVPPKAMNRAVQRALMAPVIPPISPVKQIFSTNRLTPDICAIPLIKAKTPPTNDRIGIRHTSPLLDPMMVQKPAIPACPDR